MSHLLAFIQAFFANQLFAGGFMLMVSGAIMALCRSLPKKAWNSAMERFTITVTVRYPDLAFDYLVAWLNSIPYSQKARHLEATVDKQRHSEDDAPSRVGDEDQEYEIPAFLFTPSVGNHVFLYDGNIIWLSRERDASSQGLGNKLTMIQQSFTIRCLGRSQEPIRKLMVQAAHAFMKPKDDRTKLMVCMYSGWREVGRVRPRPIESVILPAGCWDSILTDCRWFLGAADWYRERGIPYRRGYLLEGVPGSGKTATVQALAGELRMTLCILTISGHGMSDQDLNNLLLNVPPKSILLLEDIDAAFEERTKNQDNDSKITFSGLLNALDGAASADGRLLFMTTNHAERLDPALIRPGRCDVKIRFENAEADQIERLHLRFFPHLGTDAARIFAASYGERKPSMAELQARFIEESVAGLKGQASEVAA